MATPGFMYVGALGGGGFWGVGSSVPEAKRIAFENAWGSLKEKRAAPHKIYATSNIDTASADAMYIRGADLIEVE